MRVRQGGKNPFTLYLQLGAEPDRRPWPAGDRPLGMMLTVKDAEFVVQAVNAYLAGCGES